jgi:hypothetical protein
MGLLWTMTLRCQIENLAHGLEKASAAGVAGFRESLDLGSKRMTYSVFYRRPSVFIGAPAGFALEGLRTTRCEKGLRENHKGTSLRP